MVEDGQQAPSKAVGPPDRAAARSLGLEARRDHGSQTPWVAKGVPS